MATHREVALTVNGRPRQARVPVLRSLADFLRDDLGLTGTHVGCNQGACGCCTVLLDGEPVKSCLVLAVQAHGSQVLTVEGLERDGELHPVQQAFVDRGAAQCGYCTPGMIMTAVALLAEHPAPDEGAVRGALANNLCRCTGYVKIVQAVLDAAAASRVGGAPVHRGGAPAHQAVAPAHQAGGAPAHQAVAPAHQAGGAPGARPEVT